MKLKHCKLKNFGSYPRLEFDFSNLGLTLLHGKTGSGKSTLLDAPCWIMYGETSKNGAADEVRSFKAKGLTEGYLTVETHNGTIEIVRIRGSTNDLYWREEGKNEKIRGKDAKDTQKLLDQRLGADAETYVTASYYHEFSPSATFFVDKAKDRRDLLERITDLSFPKTLETKIGEYKKTRNQELKQASNETIRLEAELRQVKSAIQTMLDRAKEWENEKVRTLQRLELQNKDFNVTRSDSISRLENYLAKTLHISGNTESLALEINKFRLEAQKLNNTACQECGASQTSSKKIELLEAVLDLEERMELVKERDRTRIKIQELKNQVNTYAEQIKIEKLKANPFKSTINEYRYKLVGLSKSFLLTSESLNALRLDLSNLDALSEVVSQLRSEMLKSSVNLIKENTNRILDSFLDSEVRVDLEPTDTDSIDVRIHKSGYLCSYKQLSKGQRQLLRLSFSLSVMEAASNKAGQNFSFIALDEPSDGVDTDIKAKTLALFQNITLHHESVLVVEHNPETKAMFDNSIVVTMSDDESRLEWT